MQQASKKYQNKLNNSTSNEHLIIDKSSSLKEQPYVYVDIMMLKKNLQKMEIEASQTYCSTTNTNLLK